MKTKLFSIVLFIGFVFSERPVEGQNIPEKAVDISPLLIGEQIPVILLKNINGEILSLRDVISSKPTVLIFYRGGWCPYCNRHMAELQGIEKDILESGYQIVAISPDTPENLKVSIDKHNLSYTLLSDSKMEAAQAFGIAFMVPESYKTKMSTSSGGDNPSLMPVPAVFIASTEGEILFEYINPNYKKRLSGELLLAVLNGLK